MGSPLTDAAYVVPPLPPGEGGALDRLRRTVSRFATGAEHARRRERVERLLAAVPPAALRAAARERALAAISEAAAPASGEPASGEPASGERAGRERAGRELVQDVPSAAVREPGSGPGDGLLVPGVPLAALAAALGAADPAAVAAAVPAVAAAYHPGSAPSAAADAAAAELTALLGPGPAEEIAAMIGLLVQSCAPTATLVRAAVAAAPPGPVDVDALLAETLRRRPPVPATRRWRPDTGETVTVALDGVPFGAGPRRCPGERHALALAAGVLDAVLGGRR